MKKIFAFALAMVSSISMFAAINSQLTIYLDSESKEVEARIACGDTYSPFNPASSAAFVPMYSNATNIGMYLVYSNANYQELYAPEFVNVPLVVVTSREAASKQNYVLAVELGANNSEAVYVTDLRPDGGGAPVKFQLTNSTEYHFTLNNEAAYVEGQNCVIADRFVINYARTPDADLEICHLDNKLVLKQNPYLANIVVKDAEGNKVIDEPSTNTPQEIDLSSLPAGQYTVELDGGNRKFVIKQ